MVHHTRRAGNSRSRKGSKPATGAAIAVGTIQLPGMGAHLAGIAVELAEVRRKLGAIRDDGNFASSTPAEVEKLIEVLEAGVEDVWKWAGAEVMLCNAPGTTMDN